MSSTPTVAGAYGAPPAALTVQRIANFWWLWLILGIVLGFLLLCVGVWWIIQAFITKAVNSLWWGSLVTGIMIIVLRFWTSGQFLLQRAYRLLVFAGIWAMMQGITEIIRAFQIRSLGEGT